MGQTASLQVLRDLEDSQTVMPKDVHHIYHKRYSPPPLPKPEEVMQRLDDAYHAEELLQYGGPVRGFEYRVFGSELWNLVKKEYDGLV